MTLTPRVLAARTAPSTSDFGAWSPPIASTAMVSMFGRATLARLRLLPGPCTARSAGTRGGATWAHGNSDTPTGRRPSAHRGRGGYWSASGSVYVWDSAYRYLNKISLARALFHHGITRVLNFGALRSERRWSRLYNRTWSR